MAQTAAGEGCPRINEFALNQPRSDRPSPSALLVRGMLKPDGPALAKD
jgi:hypothetical protein